MPEFTVEEHSRKLLKSTWLAKVDDKSGYIFKAYIDIEDATCCFMIADQTFEGVWVEVLNSRGIARRARQCNHSGPEDRYGEELDDADAEATWLRRQLVLLSNMHAPQLIPEAEISVKPESDNADLEITLSTPSFRWRWDAVAASPKLSAKLLSTHLVGPLVSFAALSVPHIEGVETSALERSADLQAKTMKRSAARQLVGYLSKPIVASTLTRIGQVVGGILDPGSITASEDDYPPVRHVPPLPTLSSKGKARKRSASRSPSPRRSQTTKQLNVSSESLFRPSTHPTPGPNDHHSETEDEEEEESFPKPHARSQRLVSSPSTSARSSPVKPPQANATDSDSDTAEARRRAAIAAIDQAKSRPAIKAPTKRRKF